MPSVRHTMAKKGKGSEASKLAGELASGAWQTWLRLTRSIAMGTPEGRELMLKRHEIVVRIIELNSQALRLESEINGLDIERRNAERNRLASPTDEGDKLLTEIDQRAADLDAKREKLIAEKSWLEQSLDDFDAATKRGENGGDDKETRRLS